MQTDRRSVMVLLAWLLMLPAPPYAESAEAIAAAPMDATEADQVWSQLETITQRLQQLAQVPQSLEAGHHMLSRPCEPGRQTLAEIRDEQLSFDSRQLEKRTALSLRGGYANRTLLDDAGESSAYLELDWDVLRNGYLEYRDQARALDNKRRMLELQKQREQAEEQNQCRRDRLSVEAFTGMKIGLLELKQSLMDVAGRIERRAYFRGWSNLEDAFAAESEQVMLRMELEHLRVVGGGQAIHLPLIGVQMATVLAEMERRAGNDEAPQLHNEIARTREGARYQDRLQLYVRKELDTFSGNGDNYASLGLRFTVPLDREQSDRRLSFELRELQQQGKLESWQRLARTRDAYERVREQQQRAVRQHYRYLGASERVRRVMMQHALGDRIEVAEGVLRVRALLDESIELVRSKQELYFRVSDLLAAAGIDYRPEYIAEVPLPDEHYRARVGERAAYLWSEFFNRTDNRVLLEMLHVKSIERVVLVAGRKIDAAKRKAFVSAAQEKGIAVESLLAGSNEWIFPERRAEVVRQALELTAEGSAIHLDIEPHVLPGYNADRQTYLDHYLAMLKAVREVIGNNPLSVSVPQTWPPEFYANVASLVDHIYIMSYENRSLPQQQRRLEVILAKIGRDKAVVALSVKDFSDEWALENTMEQLSAQLGVRRFALHQLTDFIR
ncbi:MAG: hypothetical protein HY272_10230 [Gammaproteobacteria bacterium]|nr:hypothetical protein [Gammaproteobacteria bacterium]